MTFLTHCLNIQFFLLTRKNWRLRRHFCSLRLPSDKSCGLMLTLHHSWFRYYLIKWIADTFFESLFLKQEMAKFQMTSFIMHYGVPHGEWGWPKGPDQKYLHTTLILMKN